MMVEQFGIEDKNIYKICVVATMSSGKSTFINAVIGDEILPEKNEACTARTMAVLDNDEARVKKAHIIRRSGAKEIVEIDSREVLDRVNLDEDIVDFLVETDIENVKNTDKAVLLVDTPGVNNSADEQHGKRTEEFLKQMDRGMIIYLMNATQMAVTDDAALLSQTAEFINQKNGSVKILFVLNKIDALDTETESIRDTVRTAREYVQRYGIKDPVIYPMSAFSAKLLRMAYYRREMTRRERRKLEDIFENYRPGENNMVAYAVQGEKSADTYLIGEEEISGQELLRAIENTGITAVEKKICEWMEEESPQYSPRVLIRSTLKESVEERYHDQIIQLLECGEDIDLGEVHNVRRLIAGSSALQMLNHQNEAQKNAYVQLSTGQWEHSFDSLLTDIILTKRKLTDIFKNNKAIALPHGNGKYLFAEAGEQEMERARILFSMSFDEERWQAVDLLGMSEMVRSEGVVYLKNEITSFHYKVIHQNYDSTAVVLETRLPAAAVQIGGLGEKGQVSFEVVRDYLTQVEQRERDEKEAQEKVREQLERTYKGITFDSVEEKQRIIQLEKEFAQYCDELEGRSYLELQAKKKEIEKILPTVIAIPLVSKLAVKAEQRELTEKKAYAGRLEQSCLSELEKILEEIKRQGYPTRTTDELETAVQRRRIACQREIMSEMTAGVEEMSREQIRELMARLRDCGFDEELTAKFLENVQKQYDVTEEQELKSCCGDMDTYSIQELNLLSRQLQEGGYQEKFLQKYLDNIAERIRYLHIQNMEKAISGIPAADRMGLQKIRDEIDAEECEADLKAKYYQAVKVQEEKLEYEELCRLTSDLETRSTEELRRLYTDLEEGDITSRFRKYFLMRVRVPLDRAQYKDVDRMTADVERCSRDQLEDLRQTLGREGYPAYINITAEQRIQKRRFELDMQELLELGNEFDKMDIPKIEQTELLLRQKGVSEQSRKIYREKLKDRRYAIAMEEATRISVFFQQLCDKYSVNPPELKIAGFPENYRQFVDEVMRERRIEPYEDFPIFILYDKSCFSMSATHICYRTGAGMVSYRLDDIYSFCTVKKFLVERLAFRLKNGEIIEVPSAMGKKILHQFILVLNEFVPNIENPSVQNICPPLKIHVSELKIENYCTNAGTIILNKDTIKEAFINDYQECRELIGACRAAKVKGSDKWEVSRAKIHANFNISESEDSLVWIYDKTLLGSGKEGAAAGESVYVKNSGQNTISIPLNDIFRILHSENNNALVIETVNNYTFAAEIPDMKPEGVYALAGLLDKYVRGMQLALALEENFRENRNILSERSTNEAGERRYCTNCGARLDVGAKFCSSCGKRVL